MKHDPLIHALVEDLQPARRNARAERQLGLHLAWASALTLGFLATRHELAPSPSPVAIAASAVMFAASAVAAVTSAVPGRRSWGPALAVALGGALAWSIELGAGRAQDLWGVVPWQKCFRFTTAFGIAVSFGLALLLRRAWPVRPRVTAALVLASGGAAGALTTTLDCASAAPMHVLVGHLAPVFVLATAGAIAGGRLFGQRRRAGDRRLVDL
jgi:hypothetical protein